MANGVLGLANASDTSITANNAPRMQSNSRFSWGKLKGSVIAERANSPEKKPEKIIEEARSIRQLCKAVRGKAKGYVEAETGVSAEVIAEGIMRAKRYVNGGIFADDAMKIMKVQLAGQLKEKAKALLDNVVPYDNTERFGNIMLRNTVLGAVAGFIAKGLFLGGGHEGVLLLFLIAPMTYTMCKSFILPARTEVRFKGEKIMREAERAAREGTAQAQ